MVEDFGLYKVTDVVRRTDITKAGEIVENHEIYFVTKSGVSSSIVVPVSTDEKEVKKILREEAQKIENISKLKE